MRVCAHHLCRREFPGSPSSRPSYCCAKCREDAKAWRKVRGQRLVTLALNGCDMTEAVAEIVVEYRNGA